MQELQALTGDLPVSWTMVHEQHASLFVPHEVNFSEAMGKVIAGIQVHDIKINETNTDDIVRGIYQSGSAEVKNGAIGL